MNIYFNSRLNWFAVDSPDLENYLYVFLKDGRRNNSDISKLDAGFRKEDWITCSVEPEINTFVDGDLWDKDASEDTPPQSSQLSDYVKKELQQQSDNLNKVISSHLQKEKEEFTVLSYEYKGQVYALKQSYNEYYYRPVYEDGAEKLFGLFDRTVTRDFKDRTILSVRRNSDGTVFSVGDRVMAKSYIIPVDKTAIVEFKIDRLGIIDDSIGVFGGYFSLSNCEHPPQEQEAVRTFNSPEDAEIIAELENRLDDLDLKLEKQNRLLDNILNLITGYFDGE